MLVSTVCSVLNRVLWKNITGILIRWDSNPRPWAVSYQLDYRYCLVTRGSSNPMCWQRVGLPQRYNRCLICIGNKECYLNLFLHYRFSDCFPNYYGLFFPLWTNPWSFPAISQKRSRLIRWTVPTKRKTTLPLKLESLGFLLILNI